MWWWSNLHIELNDVIVGWELYNQWNGSVLLTALTNLNIGMHLKVHEPVCFVSDMVINMILTNYTQLSYLPGIKYFGLPFSVTWSVYRSINDKESSFSVGLKLMYISSVCLKWHSHEPEA